MKIRVLGTAAGGGLPQWNCACDGCRHARANGDGRTQDCLAVSGDGRSWYLLNASPDLRVQLLATPELAPGPGRRDTPLRGVLLTSAELDHTLGLLGLREASRLTVHATAPVVHALAKDFPLRDVLSHYTQVDWKVIACGQTLTLDGGLRAVAVSVGRKPPRYAQPIPGEDWVVGYRLADSGNGKTLLYAPGLPAWTDAFADEAGKADVVLLDGTFLEASEMASRTGQQRPAAGMGHLPIRDSLPHLVAQRGTRYLFTHLNNTNPLAHPHAPQHADLAAAGAAVASDGQLLEL